MHTFSAAPPCRALLYSFGEPRIRSSLAGGRGITTTGVPNLGNRQSSQLGDDSLDILARVTANPGRWSSLWVRRNWRRASHSFFSSPE